MQQQPRSREEPENEVDAAAGKARETRWRKS